MPRNSSGTMTAPTGQPVVGGTPILASTFNTLVNDIIAELTDSLSRSGKGGMLAPFKHSDGTVGDPSITFTNSPTSGLYRAGADDIGISIGGADLMRLSSTLIKLIALVTDGASAVGVEIDTANALADAGAKLLRVLNGAVEKFYLDKDGNVQGGGLFQALAAVGATLKGNVADGATAVGVILDNVNALADDESRPLSVRNAGVEVFALDKLGNFNPIAPVTPSPIDSHWTAGNGLAYWRTHDRIVHIKGTITAGSGAANTDPIFTLPEGYRPAYARQIITGNGWWINVADNGVVTCNGYISGQVSYFDALSFLAEDYVTII